MYYRHFNLDGPPFQFTPSPSVLYPSKSHQEALAALEWGLLHEPSGLTLLVGEPGTGKTTLISAILARNFERARIAYIGNPRLSFDEIVETIARQFGIAFKSSQRLARLDAIDGFLEAHARDRVMVIVDEAQALPDHVVDELRLLSNSGPRRQSSLGFVFVGQPELLRRLESPELRQLNERIGARSILTPLRPNEIYEYIEFRLRNQGGRSKDIFAPAALKHIARHCRGIPRRINVLCHNSMLLAFSSDSRRVALEHAQAAVCEYENHFAEPVSSAPRSRDGGGASTRTWKIAAFAAGVGAASLLAGYFWSTASSYSHKVGETPAPVAQDARPATPIEPAAAASDSAPPNPSPRAVTSEAAGADAVKSKEVVRAVAEIDHRLRQIRVRTGDTVAGIARRYIRSSNQIEALIAVKPQLDDIKRIYPGDVIYLPETARASSKER